MKTILVCDDDEGILEVVKIVLEDQGYNVVPLSDPEKVQSTVIKVKPNLILLDLWMPVLNGDTITQALKAAPETKNIPVIIISANKDTSAIAKKIGADSFLAKPFNIEELESLVARFL
jgi:CheY-like chemotaxis protein